LEDFIETTDGTLPTLTTRGDTLGVVVKNKINGSESLRIRKLTPREVFRLMGVKDRDYSKIADFSDSSLYRLAGNSIVIQVLMGIFGELLGIDYKKKIKESVKEIV
jgi:site-specific DNA-cytosine methylase